MSYIGVNGKDEFKIFQHYIYFSSDRAAGVCVCVGGGGSNKAGTSSLFDGFVRITKATANNKA